MLVVVIVGFPFINLIMLLSLCGTCGHGLGVHSCVFDSSCKPVRCIGEFLVCFEV